MKNALNELISRLNTGKQRINKLEDRSTEITQCKKKRMNEKQDRIYQRCEIISNDMTYT